VRIILACSGTKTISVRVTNLKAVRVTYLNYLKYLLMHTHRIQNGQEGDAYIGKNRLPHGREA